MSSYKITWLFYKSVCKIAIFLQVLKKKKIEPIHPGEILQEEFLKPMGLSQNMLAKDIGVSPRRINEIIHGKRRITADTALRLAHYFKMTPQFWLGLQMDYDLDLEEDRLSSRIEKEANVYDTLHSAV